MIIIAKLAFIIPIVNGLSAMPLFLHDLLELARVDPIHYAVDKMQGHPRDDSDEEHLDDEHPLYVRRVEVLRQKRNRQYVDE